MVTPREASDARAGLGTPSWFFDVQGGAAVGGEEEDEEKGGVY